MKSIRDLAAEHTTAARMLCVLARITDRLEAGQPVAGSDPGAITEFFQVFLERSHYAKEERKLYVAIESAGLREYRDTISTLIREHAQSRQFTGSMGMAGRKYAAGDAGAGAEFAAAARSYLALMSGHLRVEDEILFPLAEAHLTPEVDQSFLAVFERMDARELGPGRLAAIGELIQRLEAAYPE
jgi:hemerythrin-like domain-containing protein